MFTVGGDASASNTLSNVINFTPSFQIGEANRSDLATSLDQRASSEALNKNGLSASVGVGVGGGSGSGGTSSLSDISTPKSSVMDGAGLGGMLNNTPSYLKWGGALALIGGVIYFMKRPKNKAI